MANILPLALVLIVIAAGGNAGMAGAQSTPPNSSSSCTASLVSLAPCLAFLQGGLNNSSPTQGCCTSLASVVSTSAACLCQLFTTNNNSMIGISINQTRALALPGACKITTPPLSQCKSPTVSSPPAANPSSPTPVVNNPTPTAKSPATSAAVPPSTTANSGGAASPSAGSHEGPPASANAGSMTSVSMLINVVGIMGGSLATYILSASSM